MKNVEKLIIEAGLRPTKARVAVLATISHATAALSHAEILNLLEGNKEFDRVTIYRVLDWLHQHKLIHKILTDNRSWKFQSNTDLHQQQYKPTSLKKMFDNGHAHAHLQCERCGSVVCIHEFEANLPEKLIKQYHVSTIEVSLKGICATCLNA
ncbi:MAG: transcriptional repressor [Methylophilaceae bacterium]|jgi:Fur family ferric uptake transcriptional regulator|nr:MAG: transcriptional repressor [Methylophilaceae bacterium]